ncbi:hypothetical protein MNB_SV-13-2136 [hydrothermal vent metagenome]|uniref:Uncharacterized protein n=1 Tax=hydrothermal vent metagenome TaxID=652676 RepID=A0A1W1C6H5_9ZZZZ
MKKHHLSLALGALFLSSILFVGCGEESNTDKSLLEDIS